MIKIDKLTLEASAKVCSDMSPSFSGIVVGECKGDVWVDDIDNPSIALIHSSAVGGFSIFGEPTDSEVYRKFQRFITGDMFGILIRRGIDCFEFSIESDKAKPSILALFNDKTIQSEDEFTFRKDEKYSGDMAIPDKYRILKVDATFLGELESGVFGNQELLTERLLASWGTYNSFLAKSVAFVVVYQKQIAAVIVGTARYKNVIPINIETENDHRRQGLALALLRQFVNECADRGLVAQWDCMDSNIASRRTAKSAGFEFVRKSRVYWFSI